MYIVFIYKIQNFQLGGNSSKLFESSKEYLRYLIEFLIGEMLFKLV